MLGKRGFTLVELIVTIAVMGIIAAMTAPSFQNLLARQRLDTQAKELTQLFADARTQATTLRKKVTVKFDSGTGNTPTTFFWLPRYTDIKLRVNETGAENAAVPDIEFIPTGFTLDTRQVMIPNPAYISSNPTDMTTNPPTNPQKVPKTLDLSFVLCDTKLQKSKIITISKTGSAFNTQAGVCS